MKYLQPTAGQQEIIDSLLGARAPVTVGIIAGKLGVTDLEAARMLPQFVSFARGEASEIFDEIWEDLCRWEQASLLVVHEGNVIEATAKLTSGKRAQGYYNIFKGDVGGHISLGSLSAIAFVTMPVMGRETSCVVFFGTDGGTAFSVYVSRGTKQQIPSVREAYFAMREKWTA